MTKAAILISTFLLFAGVAAASSLTSSGRSNNTPTNNTRTLSMPTGAAPQGADVSGSCDESEHANDLRCTGETGTQPSDDHMNDDHAQAGPGNAEDNSGPSGNNSGPGSGGHDD